MLQMNCDLNVLDLLVDVLSSDLLLRTTAVLEEGLRAINNILQIEYTESTNSRPIRAKLAASVKLGQLLESAAVKESLEVYREADEIHKKLNPEQES
jgi:hypothetical protein